MPTKPQSEDIKLFAKLLHTTPDNMQELVRRGIVVVKADGKIDTATSLLEVSRHLMATRSTAEAKARAAEADARLKERRLQAAEKRDSAAIKPPRKGGKWSKAAEARILSAIENGKSLRAAAEAEGLTAAAVRKWMKRWPEFGTQYAHACEVKYHGYSDEMDDALDEADEAARDPECGNQRIAAIKLRIDTRKWQLSKMLPKIYGDRTQMVVEGANPADILPKHTAEEDAAFLAMLADIQAKTPPPANIAPSEE